jgi:myosin-1
MMMRLGWVCCHSSGWLQFLAGCPAAQLSAVGLVNDAARYGFASGGGVTVVKTQADAADYRTVTAAMDTCRLRPAVQQTLWNCVAAILHLGNLAFAGEAAQVVHETPLVWAGKCLQVSPEDLAAALTRRVIAARGQVWIWEFFLCERVK